MNARKLTKICTAIIAYVFVASVVAQTSSVPPAAVEPQSPHGSNTNDSANAFLIGEGLSREIEQTINALVDYTHTTCLSVNGRQPNSHSFIIVSERAIFDVESAKKAWLLTVAGAVGHTLNDNPNSPGDEVYVSDASLMKEHRSFVLNASLLQSLQRRVKNDQMTLEQMYAEITKAMVEKVIFKP